MSMRFTKAKFMTSNINLSSRWSTVSYNVQFSVSGHEDCWSTGSCRYYSAIQLHIALPGSVKLQNQRKAARWWCEENVKTVKELSQLNNLNY